MEIGDKKIVHSTDDVFPASKLGNKLNKTYVMEDVNGRIYKSVAEMEKELGYTHQRLWKKKMYRRYLLKRLFHAYSKEDNREYELPVRELAKALFVTYPTIIYAARTGVPMDGRWIITPTNNYEMERMD